MLHKLLCQNQELFAWFDTTWEAHHQNNTIFLCSRIALTGAPNHGKLQCMKSFVRTRELWREMSEKSKTVHNCCKNLNGKRLQRVKKYLSSDIRWFFWESMGNQARKSEKTGDLPPNLQLNQYTQIMVKWQRGEPERAWETRKVAS